MAPVPVMPPPPPSHVAAPLVSSPAPGGPRSNPPVEWNLAWGLESFTMLTRPAHTPLKDAGLGGITEAHAQLSWRYRGLNATAGGKCALFGTGEKDPRPNDLGLPAHPARGAACLLREGFLDGTLRRLTWSVGKRALDFSQSLFTSPAHPGYAGVGRLSDPTRPQEGFLSLQVQGPVSVTTSMTMAAVVDENAPERGVFPLARWKLGFDVFDASLVLSSRFLGFSLAHQATNSLLLYGEGNIHSPINDSFSADAFQSDGLLGASLNHASTGVTAVVEYVRNSEGNSSAPTATNVMTYSAWRANRSRFRIYSFPTVAVEQKKLNETNTCTNIAARDVVFVNLHTAAKTMGPRASVVWAASDGSSTSDVGFFYQISARTKEHASGISQPLSMALSWQQFRGKAFSWFGLASHTGSYRNRFVWSLSTEVQ